MIGKLQRVSLREVWSHEESDFTPWLQENVEVLNEILDITLSTPEREHPAGSFSVDLLAQDDTGNKVVIENQLAKSDHDHLGKIITYLSALEANSAVWIVADPRPEHIGAISWLNESSSASFYLVKVEAVRIEKSPPAPLLTLIVGPSKDSQRISQTKQDWAERDKIRYRFWTELLEKAKGKTKLHAGISPSKGGWVATSAGRAGLIYSYVIRMNDAQVELYIDCGDKETNKQMFDELAANKSEIEKKFGAELSWQRLEGKRACRVAKKIITAGGLLDEENWPQIQDEMINWMIRLEKAFAPFIKRLSEAVPQSDISTEGDEGESQGKQT